MSTTKQYVINARVDGQWTRVGVPTVEHPYWRDLEADTIVCYSQLLGCDSTELAEIASQALSDIVSELVTLRHQPEWHSDPVTYHRARALARQLSLLLGEISGQVSVSSRTPAP